MDSRVRPIQIAVGRKPATLVRLAMAGKQAWSVESLSAAGYRLIQVKISDMIAVRGHCFITAGDFLKSEVMPWRWFNNKK
ncbi:hypothetical protein [Larsenimonas rhizosphaerae]|uniref:Uncharacterized protein n=1 Tax=Larsenimonas rhizosphaerae TaxID=2944682 RepID=A0AA42CU03_9GAMM|nr:hypothetical protein [Larsenimonas rhizosphaerae]MCM2129482.1 hypothetical protein [Larsenimonas rhizosphaerae]MCX2524137.1 hypothetical protein [Larsenimonas rhizosphaerae]